MELKSNTDYMALILRLASIYVNSCRAKRCAPIFLFYCIKTNIFAASEVFLDWSSAIGQFSKQAFFLTQKDCGIAVMCKNVANVSRESSHVFEIVQNILKSSVVHKLAAQ